MIRVAAGQPGIILQVGSLHSPTAVMTLSRRGALAMSSMGRHTSGGMPLPAKRNSSKSRRTVSYALLWSTHTASKGSSEVKAFSNSAASKVP